MKNGSAETKKTGYFYDYSESLFLERYCKVILRKLVESSYFGEVFGKRNANHLEVLGAKAW